MKKIIRKSKAVPTRKVVRPKRVRMSKMRIMEIYRRHVKRLSATKVLRITQDRTIVTNDEWFNAEEIERNPAWVALPGASYVWSQDLDREVAVISRRFRLSDDVDAARLFISVDNYAAVVINGFIVINDFPQANVAFFNPGRRRNVRRFLREGLNTIVIIAFNFGGPRSAANPAGVAARLEIELED